MFVGSSRVLIYHWCRISEDFMGTREAMSWARLALLPFLYRQRDSPQEWSHQDLTRHAAKPKAKRYFYDVLINNSCNHMKMEDGWVSRCSLLYTCFKTYIAQLRTEIPYLYIKQGSSKEINAYSFCFACTHMNLLKYLKPLSSCVKKNRFISKGNYPNV